jgi:hypothetical protein
MTDITHNDTYTATHTDVLTGIGDLIERLRKRAEIRLQISTRKSVQENQPDKISELLLEAAKKIEDIADELIESQTKLAITLKKLDDYRFGRNALQMTKDLYTAEMIFPKAILDAIQLKESEYHTGEPIEEPGLAFFDIKYSERYCELENEGCDGQFTGGCYSRVYQDVFSADKIEFEFYKSDVPYAAVLMKKKRND